MTHAWLRDERGIPRREPVTVQGESGGMALVLLIARPQQRVYTERGAVQRTPWRWVPATAVEREDRTA